MSTETAITNLTGREILDSRGDTVAVKCERAGGAWARGR
jgi:enolase